ncbi:uncharacterized protein BO87DRAFT_33502 [Aspergillus neoniger CBS 115656]|uniref:Uncharacterized protein n=2 Tax=Aspergillus subgen. Circumdati TaxID=2720871 RepID=A0A318ZHS5_ASPNB|nr:hypothetical protein BO87DRAFT_33502 [Aspergillus neoniger CBS 115656]XP_025541981.1 hypothetical protein BO79DRAFT_79232 [Aspergillus costaricaensis CBS 115574]PYH35572.1 hypothetical protein BO87DRAFT_33502 [Aspergillus neoniger CBS 115656]RAK91146.1 hypothetical protein BO79DRAFT_79232 [Aspergillus costaricaensis CBS 115574]
MGNGKIDSFPALCRRKKWMGATRPAMRRPFLAPSGVSTGCLFNNRQDEAAVVAGKADVLEVCGLSNVLCAYVGWCTAVLESV